MAKLIADDNSAPSAPGNRGPPRQRPPTATAMKRTSKVAPKGDTKNTGKLSLVNDEKAPSDDPLYEATPLMLVAHYGHRDCMILLSKHDTWKKSLGVTDS